jgi:hypothetical protein
MEPTDDGLRCDPTGAHVADLTADDPELARCRCGAYAQSELFTSDELARMWALARAGG